MDAHFPRAFWVISSQVSSLISLFSSEVLAFCFRAVAWILQSLLSLFSLFRMSLKFFFKTDIIDI